MSQRLKITPARRRMLARMLAILVEDGIVEHTADGFRFLDASCLCRTQIERSKNSATNTLEMLTEINILQRCGSKLLPVLRGEYDPTSTDLCRWFHCGGGENLRAVRGVPLL